MLHPAALPTRPPLRHRAAWHLRRAVKNVNPRRHIRMWRYLGRSVPRVDLVVAVPRLAPGGVERLMLNLITALRERGLRLLVLVTGIERNLWADQLYGVADHVVLWETIPPRMDAFFIQEVVARSEATALLLTNSEATYAALGAIREARPEIRIVDILHTVGRPEENDAFLRVRMAVREHIDLAITVSSFLRRYMLDHGYAIDPDHVEVIANAVPPTISASPRTRDPDGPLPVLWLGRVDRDKDPLAIIDVAAAIHRMSPDRAISITVAGDGELLGELRMQTARVPQVPIEIVGHVQDVDGLLARHAVLLNTSPLEGQPLAVLEAVQAGLQVVAYGVGGLPELAASYHQIALVPSESGPSGLARAVLDASSAVIEPQPSVRWSEHVDGYMRALGFGAGRLSSAGH